MAPPASPVSLLRDSALAALIAFLLALPLLGVRLVDSANGLSLDGRPELVGAAVALVFCGRLLLGLTRRWLADFSLGLPRLRHPPHQIRFVTGWTMVLFALALPLLPFADRTLIDRATLVLIYVMLGWGLNITVGLAGLLDLGFVAFYAVGAYAYALLSQAFGLSFWACLPLVGIIAAAFGLGLGFPVLRLRGDYLAIVTMGFGESMRIVLQNWQSLTNGPIGISGIERPTLFGLQFKAFAKPGETTFADFFHIPFSPDHRVIFLYFMILLLALATNLFTLRIRRLPVGRAWEALREDEIACRSLGLNPTTIKLSAFALGAMFAGFAGSFFAARQGFVSPESFTFLESAMIVAIVVLGGMGSQIGIVLAALLLVALPEWIRDLDQYRMLIFGIAMVVIMLWRPSGLLAARSPTIRLGDAR